MIQVKSPLQISPKVLTGEYESPLMILSWSLWNQAAWINNNGANSAYFTNSEQMSFASVANGIAAGPAVVITHNGINDAFAFDKSGNAYFTLDAEESHSGRSD